MSNYTAILPGARVRGQDSVIGTVEHLEGEESNDPSQPDRMIVRSEDGQQHYSIPLLLVSGVSEETFQTIVQVSLAPEEMAHYLLEESQESQRQESTATDVQAHDGDKAVLRIPLAREELYAQKQPATIGTIHVHKRVETVEQRLSVPVHHEEAMIEHIPVDEFDPNEPTDPQEIIIPVMEEQLVVEKRQVIKEYIRIRKTMVTQQQEIHDMVRRETVDIEHRPIASDAETTSLTPPSSAV